MPKFGVLKHDPSAGNPYTDFAFEQDTADKDIGGLFAHSVDVARKWDRARKAGTLFKSAVVEGAPPMMMGLEFRKGSGLYEPGGTQIVDKDWNFLGLAEFAQFFLPGDGINYKVRSGKGWAPWNWEARVYNMRSLADTQRKGISETQLADIIGIQPKESGRDNPILDCVMAYQWSLISVLKEIEGRSGSKEEVSAAVKELNKVFFSELKKHYLEKLKFEDKQAYEGFSKIFAEGGECKNIDLGYLEDSCVALIGADKNPARNQRRIEQNVQRHSDVYGKKFSDVVFATAGKLAVSEPGVWGAATTCDVGGLNTDAYMASFGGLLKGKVQKEYVGAGDDRRVEFPAEFENYNQFMKAFYKSKGLPAMDGVLEALYKIQYTTLDAFGHMANPDLVSHATSPWLGGGGVILSELKKSLSEDLIKDSKNLLEVHFATQSVVQQLVSAECAVCPDDQKRRGGRDRVARVISSGVSGVTVPITGALGSVRGEVSSLTRKWGDRSAQHHSSLTDAQEAGRLPMTHYLDRAISDGFSLVEIPKKPDGTGSLYRTLNKVQVEFMAEFKKNTAKDVVFNAGCGKGKTHILKTLEEAGHDLITCSWPVDIRKKDDLVKKLERKKAEVASGKGDKEILIVLDDASKVADSFADKIEDHTAELIRKAYALGLEPKFIHSSATAQLPEVVGAKPIAQSIDDMDNNVRALRDKAIWGGGRIKQESIEGETVVKRFHSCLVRSKPKEVDEGAVGSHSVLYLPGLNEDLIRKSITDLKQSTDLSGRVFVYLDDKKRDDGLMKKFDAGKARLDQELFDSGATVSSIIDAKDRINGVLVRLLGSVPNYEHVEGEGFNVDHPKVRDRQKLVNELFGLYQGYRDVDVALSADDQKKQRLLLQERFYDVVYDNLPGTGVAVVVKDDGTIKQPIYDYEAIKEFCEQGDKQVTYLVGSENYIGRNFPGNRRMREFHVGVLGEKEIPCSMSAVAQLLGRNRVANFLDNGQVEEKGEPQMSLNFITPNTLPSLSAVQAKLGTLDLAAQYRYYMKERVKPFFYDLCDMDASAKLYADKKPKKDKEDKDSKSDPGNKYDNYLDFKKGIVELCAELCKKPEELKRLQLYQQQDDSDKGKKAKQKTAQDFLDKVEKKLGKVIKLEKVGRDYVLHKKGKDEKEVSKERRISGEKDIADFAKNMTDFALMYANWHGVEIAKGDGVLACKKEAVKTNLDTVSMRQELVSELKLKKDGPQHISVQKLRTSKYALVQNPSLVAEKEYYRVFQTLHQLEDLTKDLASSVADEMVAHVKSWSGFLGRPHGVDEVKQMFEQSKADVSKPQNAFAKKELETFTQQLESLEKILEPREKLAMVNLQKAVSAGGGGLSVSMQDKFLTINKKLHNEKEREELKSRFEDMKGGGLVKSVKTVSDKLVVELTGGALLNIDSKEILELIVERVNAPIEVSHEDLASRGKSTREEKVVSKWQKLTGSLKEREAESWRNRVSRGGQEAESDSQRILDALAANEMGDDILELVDKFEGEVDGCPVLIAAIDKSCDISIIKALLDRESVVAGGVYEGKNALHWAVGRGNVEAAKAILEKDSKLIAIADGEGYLPRDYAGENKPMNGLLDQYEGKKKGGVEDVPKKPHAQKTSLSLGKFESRHAAFSVAAIAGAVMAGLLISGIFALSFAVTASLATVAVGLSLVGIVGAVPVERKVVADNTHSKIQSPSEMPSMPTIPPVALHNAVSRLESERSETPREAGHSIH